VRHALGERVIVASVSEPRRALEPDPRRAMTELRDALADRVVDRDASSRTPRLHRPRALRYQRTRLRLLRRSFAPLALRRALSRAEIAERIRTHSRSLGERRRGADRDSAPSAPGTAAPEGTPLRSSPSEPRERSA
jgi:hypothetical protein